MSVDEGGCGMMRDVFGKPVVLFDGKDGEVDGLLFVLDKPPEDGMPGENAEGKTEEDKKEE